MLAYLNLRIIFEFKKISKRRKVLSHGIGCSEISGYPSPSANELSQAAPDNLENGGQLKLNDITNKVIPVNGCSAVADTNKSNRCSFYQEINAQNAYREEQKCDQLCANNGSKSTSSKNAALIGSASSDEQVEVIDPLSHSNTQPGLLETDLDAMDLQPLTLQCSSALTRPPLAQSKGTSNTAQRDEYVMKAAESEKKLHFSIPETTLPSKGALENGLANPIAGNDDFCNTPQEKNSVIDDDDVQKSRCDAESTPSPSATGDLRVSFKKPQQPEALEAGRVTLTDEFPPGKTGIADVNKFIYNNKEIPAQNGSNQISTIVPGRLQSKYVTVHH